MSNPRPYGVPGEQATPWPQYGQGGANGAMPAQGGYPGAGYAGPAVMPPMNLPSRAPGTIMIVVGLLMMLIVAPIVFVVVAFSGLNTDMPEDINAVNIKNGGTVEVGANGQYTVLFSKGEATSCTRLRVPRTTTRPPICRPVPTASTVRAFPQERKFRAWMSAPVTLPSPARTA